MDELKKQTNKNTLTLIQHPTTIVLVTWYLLKLEI